MVAVEEILWNIFTFYTLNSNPRDPSKMHNTALVKLCKDIMIFDPTMTECALTHADLQLIYTSCTTNPEKVARLITNDKSDKMEFDAFLSCLIKIAKKAYPSGETKEGSMQQLLMDNLLPMASKRKPVSIALLLKQPNIEAIFKYYEDSLQELYKFYTTSSDLDRRGKNMVRSMSHLAETFDDQREVFQEAKNRSSKDSSNAPNRMGYPDFIRFANDFGLVTGLGITTLDLGDIYLTVTYFTSFVPQLRKMEFREFWEAIVRCALVAFQDKKSLTTETKVKGLFLSIWRHIQSSVQDHMNGYGTIGGGGFNTYKGALLRGTQILNDRFVAAWTKDDYRDYLAPLVAPSPTGKNTPAKEKLHSAMGNSPPPPPPTSTISKVLKGASSNSTATVMERGRTRSNSNPLTTKSPIKSNTSGKSKMTATELITATEAGMDALTEDKLLHIGHSKIAHSDNFLVQLPEGGLVRIKISDHEELNDRRIQPRDLRKILHEKPSIAGILFEAMLELGIAHANDIKEGADEDDNASDGSQSLDLKDMISNNTPMFGRGTTDEDGTNEDDFDQAIDDGLHQLSLSNDEEFA